MLYGHVDDRETRIAETVGAFGALQVEGVVGITGISNVSVWRVVEAARRRSGGTSRRTAWCSSSTATSTRRRRSGGMNFVTPELLDYAASTGVDGRPPLAVTAYSPLHQGALTRTDKPLWGGVDHPTTHARLRVLHEVARDIGATPNQVALAWLLGGEVPVIPVVGASSLAQLEETLGAAELDLDPEVRARLDAEPIGALAAAAA